MKVEPSPILNVYFFKNENELNKIAILLKNYPNIVIEYTRKQKNGFKMAVRQIDFCKQELTNFKIDSTNALKKKKSFLKSFLLKLKNIRGFK